MKRRHFDSLADYFKYGPETQQEFAARLSRKYRMTVSQASVSEAVKHGRGSYARLCLFSKESGVPLESFHRKAVA